jgi:putative inorganic carbon (HCO3(-)) transporter
MRDFLLASFIIGSLPFVLWRPRIGVLLWVWIGVMNPHRLTWSFAYDFQFAAVIAVATLTGAVLSKDLKWPPVNTLTVALCLFIAWTGLTTVFALYPEAAFEKWKALVKTQLMVLLIPMLFHKKEDLRWLIWVLALSIAYFGVKGGLWTLLSGGVDRVYGPRDSYIADNNAIALALVMTIPLLRYLQLTSPHRYVRWGLIAMMILCGVAVLGTYSRGALVAAVAMLCLLWWKGKHKLAVLLIIVSAVPLALALMPDPWHQRMDTIAQYEQDDSARMRLNAWQTMITIAKDRPLMGGGFDVGSPEVYARYSPDPQFPPQSAHSVYFQALGEHGFVGLAVYLFVLLAFWRTASKVARVAISHAQFAWARHLSLMIQVTLIGFGVGGAFLTLLNFDVPYYLLGIMAAVVVIVERELAMRAPVATRSEPRGFVMPRAGV